MHGHVTGEILYKIIDKNVFSIFGKNKCSAICTDGARVMTGRNQGLIGWLIKNNIKIPSFHCIIHQQSLFSKELNMSHTMEIAVKIINKIKGDTMPYDIENSRSFSLSLSLILVMYSYTQRSVGLAVVGALKESLI